jgi:lactoylglutathione lyase
MAMKNTITGITHCSFYCKDFEKMVSFYRDTLELEQLFTLRHPDGNPWLTYLKVTDRQFIELFSDAYTGDNKWGETGFTHVSLIVEDMFEATRTLERKGVMITRGPSAHGDILRIPYLASDYREGACGSMTAWVQDPEGNEIELMQYTPVSMQVRCL